MVPDHSMFSLRDGHRSKFFSARSECGRVYQFEDGDRLGRSRIRMPKQEKVAVDHMVCMALVYPDETVGTTKETKR